MAAMTPRITAPGCLSGPSGKLAGVQDAALVAAICSVLSLLYRLPGLMLNFTRLIQQDFGHLEAHAEGLLELPGIAKHMSE